MFLKLLLARRDYRRNVRLRRRENESFNFFSYIYRNTCGKFNAEIESAKLNAL